MPRIKADVKVSTENVRPPPRGPLVGRKRTGIAALLLGNRRRGEGLTAGWWAVGALSGFVAAIGGIVKGMPWAAAFFVPALCMTIVALQRAREGNY